MRSSSVLTIILALIFISATSSGLTAQELAQISKTTVAPQMGWITSCVACNTTAGFPSLALDSQGYAHLTYIDYTQPAVIYASLTQSGWISETLDTAGSEYSKPALAIDSLDRAHVAYIKDSGSLIHLLQNGNTWEQQIVDVPSQSAYTPDLALDDTDNAHIIYVSGGEIYYAHFTPSGWITETTTLDGSSPSIAVDDAGNPHLSYELFVMFSGSLNYAYRDNQAWHSEMIMLSGSIRNPSLGLDSQGFAHISYNQGANDGEQYFLGYAYQDAQGWHTNRLDNEDEWVWKGNYSSLKLDQQGYPHISYQYVSQKSAYTILASELRYIYQDAQGWHIQTVDPQGISGVSTSLALTAVDLPRIVYKEDTTDSVLYAWYGPVYRLYIPAIIQVP